MLAGQSDCDAALGAGALGQGLVQLPDLGCSTRRCCRRLSSPTAEQLQLPFERISVEMVFRGLYHFRQAHAQGCATDPVQYFAAPENQDLRVVKVLRQPPPPLNLAPFPQDLTIPAPTEPVTNA